MDYKVVPSSIIFLFVTWYIDSAARWGECSMYSIHFILEQILVSHSDDDMELK